ncbi:shikimate O-hydroxycinnamoyltransferase-like [Dorcoceras hygrometricum]|uniref:Shikimate O-hydroxycinnamoyltransferase-like n=1 Tax=Dorcoceras hygrometricum TaxID=472368 RepID=A0A2Z7BQZ6_9LAMI|nr:shikimate O-hydroxycinnamoyltransferase-like [Dorcoceras hygrometricum]
MSLFDLQDVCIVIGSLATLDVPMVIDLIGIYVLKGPYCMLTTTKWFLQALSMIPRGSWGDVSRRFTMIRWVDLDSTLKQIWTPPNNVVQKSTLPTGKRHPASTKSAIAKRRRFALNQNTQISRTQTSQI